MGVRYHEFARWDKSERVDWIAWMTLEKEVESFAFVHPTLTEAGMDIEVDEWIEMDPDIRAMKTKSASTIAAKKRA